jgi:hydroxymethylbilane synthase
VRSLLLAKHPDLTVELVKITSSGDVVRDRPLYQMGAVGVFTKEVQDALLADQADLAVHSLKDLPTETPAELTLGAVPERAMSADALLAPKHRSLANLPQGAKVGSSSLRRRAQLLRLRPDLAITDVRGNVETRIQKLHAGQYDAILLARAGLDRLGLDGEITELLEPPRFLPAVSQGALGLECRASDERLTELLQPLNHRSTRKAVEAERAYLRTLRGGCHAPVAALAVALGDELTITGRVLSQDGKQSIEGSLKGAAESARELGERLAQQLLDQGAGELLR